jgi:tetratricopeptide (TPR) repeat protein
VIGPKIEQAIKLSSMKKYDDALLVLGELGFYQNSFSASWLKVLIEKSKFKSTKLSSVSKAMFSNVFAPKSAAKVLKVMEKSSNPELLEKALKILIRDLPKNPYYRWKLSGLFLKSGDCKKVITLKIPKYKMNPKHKAGLLEHKARCYESTRDYKSAEKSLKTMARLVPTEWRVHYQLGNVYFKNKEKFKAISAYREALSLKPPKSFISIMNGRLDEIGAKDPKQEN